MTLKDKASWTFPDGDGKIIHYSDVKEAVLEFKKEISNYSGWTDEKRYSHNDIERMIYRIFGDFEK